jgi:DNA polymerase-3 subunit alpha
MADEFVHIHTHSEYSLLDGLGRVKDLVKEAKRLGQKALAITDHGAMHGAVEFFRACKGADIKPIIGVETYQTIWGRAKEGRDPQFDKENYHQLLIAQNMTGYRNLLKLVSDSNVHGFYYKPRIDHALLEGHAEGLICTTGCLGAEVPQLIMQGREKEAYERLGWYVDLFGKDRFFIELQEHSIDELKEVNKILVPWADKFGLQLLVTNDVHYVREQDSTPHEVLLCVQTGTRMQDEKRMRLSDQSYFLKSRAQMEATFRPLIDLPPSAFDNSLRIAEMCNVDLEDPTYHLPDLPIPEGFTYATYLRHLTEQGLERLYGERAKNPEVQERKERELRIIGEMGFDVYFLIVADLCDFARSRGIWWNVRGSGAGSLVAYCIGITGLDPLKNNLIFERFLNPGRVSMPDFDLDYPDDQREEMIRYTVEKYGSDQVAQIVTFGRMKARAAIRDVGRAKDVPLNQVDRLAKLIPAIPGKPVTIREVLTEGHEFYDQELMELYAKEEWVRDLLDTSMQLEGVARHSGIHAAAVIVADRKLDHYTPLMRGSKSTVTQTVTQYEFPILESIGLLKVDFLGLSTLTVLREACRLIKEQHGVEWRLDTIPFEGEAAVEAFKLLSSGEVSGVFQVESQGMRRVLTEMRPSMFEHIIATISLYRPGPLEYIPNFIRRMHGNEEIEYKHPSLESILGETYGICVSGDAMIIEARSGQRYRLDEIGKLDEFYVQGVDDNWQPAVGRVTHWIDSGIKPVFRLTLRNGASLKVTEDHRLLTEEGWRPLNELRAGDYVATPPYLFGPQQTPHPIDRRKLRVLAYLLADGSLASMAAVDFVSKDENLLAEYQRCLFVFGDIRPSFTAQIRGVTRISAAKSGGDAHYHEPNALLRWLRELGLKHPAGQRPGGLRSHEKYVPDFVFELGKEDIAFFLASLWECDGYIDNRLCHYKTISPRLAEDVQTLLLRLGIHSVTYQADYVIGAQKEKSRTGYQVTIYDTAKFAALLQPHMVSVKREKRCTRQSSTTIARAPFLAEVEQVRTLSYRGLMKAYGIDRQHFYPRGRNRQRIYSHVITPLTTALALPETSKKLHVAWEEITTIEYVGPEHVYDLTVESLHSFVADNIVVHNCVYQEQIIQILSGLAGYTPGEADLVRRAISKKKASDIEYHKKIFVEGCFKNGIPKDAATAIYEDIEFFARYGFNKSHAADYAVITVQTAYLKAHYPVEYMAALLLVERDKTEKVINFINECRRMGIQVLPPDVNYSGMDFESQAVPADSAQKALTKDPSIAYDFPVAPGAAIRFGMAAVKNVGEGPVSVILEERKQGGPFRTLEDFCDRVDLRHVNKRSLECLIKVGALDRFGHRSQLLHVLDQMVARSAAAHSAKDSGQISMFDLLGDDGAPQEVPILLPKIEEVKSRERLQWEKELLGVFASSHPLQQLKIDLMEIVTCSCAELNETHDDKVVTIGGMIADIRTTITKKGDKMAFLRIEDMLGQCEVVLFPRTYEQYKDQLEPDRVILVVGKAQARNGRTSVLAEEIKTSLEIAREVVSNEDTRYQEKLIDMPTFNGRSTAKPAIASWDPSMDGYDLDNAPVMDEESPFAQDIPDWLPPVEVGEDLPVAVSSQQFVNEMGSKAKVAEKTVTISAVVEPMERAEPEDVAPTRAESTPKAGDRKPAPDPKVGEPKSASTPQILKETPAQESHSKAGNGSNGHKATNGHGETNGHSRTRRTLKIIFSRCGQLDRDKYRLREIVDAVRDPKGRDQFLIIMEADGRRHQLSFPNDFCTVSERLLGDLQKYFNVDVSVEE